MKRRFSDDAAASMTVLAVTARVFSGVSLEMPELVNSGWICTLLGGLLTLPTAFAVSSVLKSRDNHSVLSELSKKGLHAPVVFFCLSAIVLSLLQSATSLCRIAASANYIALTNSTRSILVLPALLLGFFALLSDGDAVGAAARIWNRIIAALCLLIAILELKHYRPAWLFPIAGPGLTAILSGSFRIAGWMSLFLYPALLSEPHNSSKKGFRPIRVVLTASLAASILLITRSMMVPPILFSDNASEFSRLDMLLSNGRAPLSMQLPTAFIWFVGLFFLVLAQMYIALAAIRQMLPKAPRLPIIFLITAVSFILSLPLLSGGTLSAPDPFWLYPFLGLSAFIIPIVIRLHSGGKHSHA